MPDDVSTPPMGTDGEARDVKAHNACSEVAAQDSNKDEQTGSTGGAKSRSLKSI